MTAIDTELERREQDGAPIRVAMVGAGFMGTGMTRHIEQNLAGMTVSIIVNRTVDRAVQAFREAGIDDVDLLDDREQVERAVAAGRHVVASHPDLACRAAGIDAVVEATGDVEFGAQVASMAIESGKHVILVNAELDATVGPILKVHADRAGVVLTNAAGDEPGVAMDLARLVRLLGYRPVMAGNIKGFLDPHRTPDTQRAFAERNGQRPKMITSFADGTKLSMEATVLSNATGFDVAQRGMSGYECGHVNDVMGLYDLDGLLERPLVDYVLGAEPGSGAFVIGYNPDEVMGRYMAYFKMGAGPFHLFYRPFHLTHLEAPISIARAVISSDPTIAALGAPVSEVMAFAKKDLEPGDTIDGIGGFTCYGVIDRVDVARQSRAVPMGLVDDAVVARPVAADAPLTLDDVRLPEGRLVDRLRAEQDSYFAH